MRKRNKSPEETGSWMDTYGDMVTLLLCFFVLLYSISTIDQAKWVQIVQSFNPEAVEEAQQSLEEEASGSSAENVNLNSFDNLYEQLKASVDAAGLSSEVELYKGDDYTFITFRNSVFFDGDSSVIREEGKVILDQFSAIVSGVSEEIKEIQVLGHTTQEDPNSPNNPEVDRMLSAERSARVVAYVQQRTNISPDKLVSVGYGQYRPIAPFDTEENRAKNRRVEIIITKSDAVQRSLEEYYAEINR